MLLLKLVEENGTFVFKEKLVEDLLLAGGVSSMHNLQVFRHLL